MDARSFRRVGAHFRLFAAALAMIVAPARAEEPAAPPAFQPGEISIGEPIALPFGGRTAPAANPAAANVPATPPIDDPLAARAPTADAATVPGSGWLGLAVAPSSVPGRWRVEDVTAGGPAARASIAVGDELRAVNGSTLSSAEEVSRALTAIAAGQDVRVAVARGEQVSDVTLRAESRPPVRTAEPQAATTPPGPLPTAASTATAVPSPPAQPAAQTPAFAQSAATLPAAALPTPAAQPAARQPAVADAALGEPAFAQPAAGTAWQAADERKPEEAPSRFAPRPDPAPTSVMTPAPTSPPAAAAVPAPANTAATAPRRFVPPAAPLPAAQGTTGRTALGVRTVAIDPATQKRFGLREPAGAYVIGVVDGLPAGKAGVPPGSVIVAVGDQPVRSPVELTKLVTNGPLDRPVPVDFVLPGGESKRANVVLQPLDAPLERVLTGDGTPQLQPAPVPRRAERPTGATALPADIRAEIKTEIRALRGRLERLERLLDPTGRGR